MLKAYRIYMQIFLIVCCSLLIAYFIISLYILHKCTLLTNKGDKLNMSPVLPEFLKEYLEKLKLYSIEPEVVKYIKRNYYGQIVIYTLALIWTLSFLFLY